MLRCSASGPGTKKYSVCPNRRVLLDALAVIHALLGQITARGRALSARDIRLLVMLLKNLCEELAAVPELAGGTGRGRQRVTK